MGGFDLKAHITGHAHTVSDGLPESFDLQSPQNTHFTFSFDKSQFILNHNTTNQKEIDKIMTDFFEDLKTEELIYSESNGPNKARRTRTLDLSNCLLAYHNSSSEAMNNYAVYDHIHILAPGQLKEKTGKSTKLGSSYSHLRNLISQVATRHNLVANFEEATQFEKNKSSKASATGITWYMKKASDKAFYNAVKNGNVLKALGKIEAAYKKGDTTQDHLYKGYIDLQYRLNKLNLDLLDQQGKNLRYDFPILLNSDQKKEIEILKSGDRDKITKLIQNRDSKLTRACIEQSFGFNSVAYDVLQNKGNLLDEIDLSLIREIANDPNVKVAIEKKDLNFKKKNWEKSLGYHVKQDIETVLKHATNEKEFRECLKAYGYQDLKFKHQNKQKIGVSFISPHNNKPVIIYFNQIRMSMPQITKQLMENKQLQNQGKLLQFDLNYENSFLSKYIPKEKDLEYINQKKKYQDLQFERIYGRTPQADLTGYYIQEDKILKKGTFIEVQDNKITVKRQNKSELENNVKLIIDTASAKGWDLTRLNIKGTPEFKLAVQNELERRSNNKSLEVKEQTQIQKVSFTPKLKDTDILKQLKAMNLHNYDYKAKPKEYAQVWDIIEKAVKSKDLELLNACYDTLPHEYTEELRQKLVNYGKVLGVSSNDINIAIGESLGLNKDEVPYFIDMIKSSNGYDEKFLSLYVEKIEEKLTDHYIINQDLADDQLEIAMNLTQRLSSEFNQYKSLYVDQKSYVKKIEDIENYLEVGLFYSAKKLINELDNDDKIIYNTKYENKIDMFNIMNEFDELKNRIDEQSQLDQKAYLSEIDETKIEDIPVSKETKDQFKQQLQQQTYNRNYYHTR